MQGKNMYKIAINDLIHWKNKNNKKPLIIHGARQVGKTWLMKEFGNKHYQKLAYINFENNERMKNLFLFQHQSSIFPLEVKASENLQSKSLS